jgi:hypothetical protein
MGNLQADTPPEGHPVHSLTPKVGFRQPPEAWRFKPGRSGNPGGRPKGAKNLATLVLEHLQAKITIRENGRERQVSKVEVGLIRMANRFAEKGELQVFKDLKKLLDRPDAQTIEVRRRIEIDQLTADQLICAAEEHMDRQLSRLTAPENWTPKTLPGEPAWYEPPQIAPSLPPLCSPSPS